MEGHRGLPRPKGWDRSTRMVLLMIITPFKMAEMRMEPDQVNIALGIVVRFCFPVSFSIGSS